MSKLPHRGRLLRAARLAESDPRFVAWALGRFREGHGLDDGALAACLGCLPSVLPILALRPRPHPNDPGFARDVHSIATFVDCEPGRLQALLTETGTPAKAGRGQNAGRIPAGA